MLALARFFDYNLLVYMFSQFVKDNRLSLPPSDLTPEEKAQKIAHDMIDRLQYYSVIQNFERGEKKFIRVHYLVQERMEDNLAKEEPTEFIEYLHKLMANYYGKKEIGVIRSEAEYTRMFRYEHPGWQMEMIEFLHHLSRLQDRDQARITLTRLYLEAFDWWGWSPQPLYCRILSFLRKAQF